MATVSKNAAHDRPFDIIVFGATGFTGQLVATYLARAAVTARAAGRPLRWAIAGRSVGKLEEVRRAIAAVDSVTEVALIEADVSNAASLAAMAAKTRVVLTTVGPYAQYGEPLVKACVEQATDYVDITGEPAFVDMTLARYDEAAKKAGVRIVSCCGFDSIPHDLGAQLAVEALAKKAPNEPYTIEGFVRSRGTFSGGTWQSAIGAMARIRQDGIAPKPARTPATHGRSVRGLKAGVFRSKALKAWAVPLPTIDPQVVLRSARALDSYGPEFRYGHFARIKNLSTIVGGAIGLGAMVALAQLPPTRKLLLKVRGSGEGPSADLRAKSWFEVTFLGRAGSGATVVAKVAGKDPGYDETAKMVSESALCLALDRDVLPAQFGVVTTAVAMGAVLRERLVRAGMTFEVE